MIANRTGRRPGRRRLLEPDRRQRRRDVPRAEEHVHCRNCPVFAEAARGFFGRRAPEGISRSGPTCWAGRPTRAADAPRSWSSGWAASGWPWRSRWSPRSRRSGRSTGSRTGPTASSRAWSASGASCSSASRCTACSRSTRPTRPTSPGEPRLVLIRRGSETGAFPAEEVVGVQHLAPGSAREGPSTLANPAGSFSRAVFAWGRGGASTSSTSPGSSRPSGVSADERRPQRVLDDGPVPLRGGRQTALLSEGLMALEREDAPSASAPGVADEGGALAQGGRGSSGSRPPSGSPMPSRTTSWPPGAASSRSGPSTST